ncbi:MAG: STAS domain-containing protein [Planctomycetes bacterium]|nr:STAS domain-containing protein [Planctomycetota bacterium]
MPEEAPIVARKFHDVIIATPAKESLFERAKIHQIRDKLTKYLDVKKPPALVVDLEHTENVSSEAIGALMKIRDHAVANGIQFRICNLQPAVHEVLDITELADLFDIYDTLPDAYRGLVPEDS